MGIEGRRSVALDPWPADIERMMMSQGDDDYSQFTVLVGTVPLEVLSDSDSLLDQVVEVLGNGGGET